MKPVVLVQAMVHSKVGSWQMLTMTWLIGRRTDQKKALQNELEKLRKEFTVDTNHLKKITKRFQEELEEGKGSRYSFGLFPWSIQHLFVQGTLSL